MNNLPGGDSRKKAKTFFSFLEERLPLPLPFRRQADLLDVLLPHEHDAYLIAAIFHLRHLEALVSPQ